LLQLSEDRVIHYVHEVFADKGTQLPLFGPLYRGTHKTQVLQDMFGDRRLGDVLYPFAVVVDRLDGPPEVLCSWETAHSTRTLVEVLDASSAVPLLFPAVQLGTTWYMDGSSAIRSPICVGYLLGTVLFGAEAVVVLSIGTSGRHGSYIASSAAQGGLLQFIAAGAPLCLLSHGAILLNDLTRRILAPTDRFLRLEGAVATCVDDTTSVVLCRTEAHTVWDAQETSVRSFLGWCTKPRIIQPCDVIFS
jgi:hypothetical protein